MDHLLDSGADPKAVDKRKVSALQYACAQGRLEVVQRLYRRGVELDAEDPGMVNISYGLKPLQAADYRASQVCQTDPEHALCSRAGNPCSVHGMFIVLMLNVCITEECTSAVLTRAIHDMIFCVPHDLYHRSCLPSQHKCDIPIA